MSADELSRLLDELGKRLGPAGSHVFELAVRQVFINGITSALLLIGVVAVGLRYLPRLYRWQQDGGSGSDREIGAALGIVGYGIVALVAAMFAITFVPAMLNPEYAAIRDLLGTVRR